MARRRTVMTLAFMLAAAGCASVSEPKCAPDEHRSVSELLYFGTAKPNGVVTAEDWAGFLKASVTSRFPQGLTVWPASGQWQSAEGEIVREASLVLNLLHPDDERSETAVRAIAAEYKSRFSQDAVLRVKSHACASF